MLETIFIPIAILAAAIGLAGNTCQRGLEQQAAFAAGQEISGFTDLYYAHEIELDGSTFPELVNKPLPLSGFVYQIVPPTFLHDLPLAGLSQENIRQ